MHHALNIRHVAALLWAASAAFAACAAGDAEGWHMPKELWRIERGAGRDGGDALVWESRDPEKYAYPSRTVALEPGGIYRFGGWFKVDVASNATPLVCIDMIDERGAWSGARIASPMSAVPAPDGWVRLEGVSEPLPSEVRGGRFLAYVKEKKGATGRIRFCGFDFEKIGERRINHFLSSAYRGIAWAGKVRFAATLNIDTRRTPLERLAAEIRYRGADGGTVRRPADTLSADAAFADVAVDGMARGEQEVTFALLPKGGGAALAEARLRFTRTDGPSYGRVAIDPAGRVRIGGKPFFPLGCCTGRMTAGDIREYAKGPFNFALQYDMISKKDLDQWSSIGVKALADVRTLINGFDHFVKSPFKTEAESQAALRQAVAEVGGHSALLGWLVADEVPQTQLETVANANRFLHAIDPHHPTYAALDRTYNVRSALGCFDAFGMDPYPIGNPFCGTALNAARDMDEVSQWVRLADDAAFGMRPQWHIPQAFNWAWYAPGAKDCGRMPERDEIANMAWQSIAAGANGICFFSYWAISRRLKGAAYEKAWGDVCAVAREVKAMEGDLLAADMDWPGGREAFAAGIACRAWRTDEAVCLLAVNRTRRPLKATIPLPAAGERLDCVLGDGVSLDDGGRLVADLPPLGYAFSRIK